MKKLIPILALTLVTAMWGSTFFMIRTDALNELSASDFLTVRFFMAAILATVIWGRDLLRADRKTLALGFGLGLLYGIAQLVQTIGLYTTDASVSGFITAMYIVIVPVVALVVFREQFKPITWLWVALAGVGLAALSLKGWSFGAGEFLTFVGAIFFAIQVAGLSVVAPGRSAGALTTLQMWGTVAVSFFPAVSDGIQLPQSGLVWAELIYMATVCSVGAIFLETWAQARMSSTEAALIMAAEPLFATLFAVVFGGETLTLRLAIGAAFIMTAIVSAQLTGVRPDRILEDSTKDKVRIEV